MNDARADNTAAVNQRAHTHVAGPDAGVVTRTHSWTPEILLSVFCVIWAMLAIAPLSRADWLLENLLVLIAIPALIATRTRMPFTSAAYACMFSFFVLHSIGSHYTYAQVPYDRWAEALTGNTINDIFGWERNHYDRLVHFLYGVLMLLPSMELLQRYAPGRAGWQWIMPILFITSHSAIYETVEWLATLLVAPDLGTAYLGTQGDEWDAQQDMALASAGAIISALFIYLIRRHHHSAH